jgi:hypothetical protein
VETLLAEPPYSLQADSSRNGTRECTQATSAVVEAWPLADHTVVGWQTSLCAAQAPRPTGPTLKAEEFHGGHASGLFRNGRALLVPVEVPEVPFGHCCFRGSWVLT